MDKSHIYQGIFATLRCNLSCECCCREEDDIKRELYLSYRQLRESLEETQFFNEKYHVHKIFTGGEPTLWREGGKGIADVMVETAQLGFFPMLLTNGTAFLSEESTARFVDSYLSRASLPIEIFISTDFWHGNIDKNGRCLALDNLLSFRNRQGSRSALTIAFSWTCSTRPEHFPPEQFLTNYQKEVDASVYFPLTPRGKGHHLSSIAPKLRPADRNKEPLGAYSETVMHRMLDKGWIKKAEDFLQMDNSIILNECSTGNGTLFLYADGHYYTCADGIGNEFFHICDVGKMTRNTMDEFFAAKPVFKLLRELGPLGLLRRFAEEPEITDIHNALCSFGISERGGCAIHRLMLEKGLFQRINASLVNGRLPLGSR